MFPATASCSFGDEQFHGRPDCQRHRSGDGNRRFRGPAKPHRIGGGRQLGRFWLVLRPGRRRCRACRGCRAGADNIGVGGYRHLDSCKPAFPRTAPLTDRGGLTRTCGRSVLASSVTGPGAAHHGRVIAECPAARLAAVAETDETRRAEALDRHPQVAVVADYRELLKRADIEAVSVVLPSHLHIEVGRARCDRQASLPGKANGLVGGRLPRAGGPGPRRRPATGRHSPVPLLFALGQGQANDRLRRHRRPAIRLDRAVAESYRTGADGWRYDIRRWVIGSWKNRIHFFDLARWYFAGSGEPVWSMRGPMPSIRVGPNSGSLAIAIVNFAGGRYAVISQTLGAFEHHQVAKLDRLPRSVVGKLEQSAGPHVSSHIFPQTLRRPADGRRADSGRRRRSLQLADAVADMAEAVQTGRAQRNRRRRHWSVSMCLKAGESVATGKWWPYEFPPSHDILTGCKFSSSGSQRLWGRHRQFHGHKAFVLERSLGRHRGRH